MTRSSLASMCSCAREEGLVVSRERVYLLTKKGWWSRECVFVCSRGRAGGLASACLSAREEGLVVSRVRVCLLARKGWWPRECVFDTFVVFPCRCSRCREILQLFALSRCSASS